MRARLLDGVRDVTFPGVPGEIIVCGRNAVPFLFGKNEGVDVVLAAAAPLGKGRLVAFGHPGFLTDFAQVDTSKLLQNALEWSAHRDGTPTSGKKPAATLRVGVRGVAGLVAALQKLGLQAANLDGENWEPKLREIDVLVMTWAKESKSSAASVEKFVTNGGGFVVAAGGWIWQGYHAPPGARLADDMPLQAVAAPSGICWSTRTVENPQAGKKTLVIPEKAPSAIGLDDLLSGLEPILAGSQTAEAKHVDEARSLASALQQVPVSSECFARLKQSLVKSENIAGPTPSKPLGKTAHQAKVVTALRNVVELRTPVAELKPAATAAAFPGTVSPSAPRVVRERVDIDTRIPEWHSTGLYAAPGEAVGVTIPAELVEAGFKLLVGCHRDNIGKHPSWKRPPLVTREFPLREARTTVGNAYGGLLYVLVPEKLKQPAGTVSLEFSGAVKAPLYVHGVTAASDWRDHIRHHPAPFGELVCDRIILTVRSADLQKLDLPEQLMDHWISVVDCYADLAGIARARKRPERIVPDVQISAGWLHSGYPIMAQDLELWSGKLVNLAEHKSVGNWGFLHELGHNHQKKEWTFEGTVEVTCNVFVLYVLDQLNKGARPHDAVQPAEQKSREVKYVKGGRRFDDWKGDPFLALIMYEQLSRTFGWETLKKVFAEYNGLAEKDRPKTDAERRDQWLVRYSRATGRNLSPFFEHWGIPVSDAAKNSLADLPKFARDDVKPLVQP